MKVRIGVAAGSATSELGAVVDACEARGIDSLWFSERPGADLVDPIVGMAHAVSRTTNLKVGTGVVVLPGRNPVVLAKQLASLAALAPRRVLPAFGLQAATPAERQLYPVTAGERGRLFDECLLVLRRLLSEPEVTHHGEFFTLEGAHVDPLPLKPLDLWLGGQGPKAMERIGRLADGWLAAFMTPEQTAAGRVAIDAAAAAAGRAVDADHHGVSIPLLLSDQPLHPAMAEALRSRNPDADPEQVVPRGWAAARDLIRAHVEGGITKFVVRPVGTIGWEDFLDALREELLPLEAELSS
ncbi:MAG TPA: TIGR03854 family LLM class F420-dependent oxidoreductase [Mycobacteriales bacterium]|nr:TIGR03854 family LLM class F420-dependent oxidoreductase [Mycobacteriales bacterium]